MISRICSKELSLRYLGSRLEDLGCRKLTLFNAIASYETRRFPGRKLNLSAAIFLWSKIDFSFEEGSVIVQIMLGVVVFELIEEVILILDSFRGHPNLRRRTPNLREQHQSVVNKIHSETPVLIFASVSM